MPAAAPAQKIFGVTSVSPIAITRITPNTKLINWVAPKTLIAGKRFESRPPSKSDDPQSSAESRAKRLAIR